MKRNPITTKQFIAFSVLVTLAFVFLIINQGRFSFLFTTPLLIATFVIMPAEVRRQPVTFRELLIVLGGVAATAAFIGWTVTHHTPENDARDRSLGVFISHPAVAVPWWLLFLYLGYRRWRMKPPLQEAASHDHEQPRSP